MSEKRSICLEKQRISSSISKAARFYIEKDTQIPGPGRYSIKEQAQSGIKFADSKRSPLYQFPDSPPPGAYDIPSCFDKGKSFSFSPKLSKSMPKYPGPGNYEVKEVVKSSARAVFGKEKRKDNFLNLELVNIPGPGRYNFRNTLVEGPGWKFGSQESRKKQEIEDFPGPGTYDLHPFRQTAVHKFPSSRKPEKISKIPGPGHYNVSTPKATTFFLSKAEKFQKLSGPLLPGPSDYYYSDMSSRLTPNSPRGNKTSIKATGGTLSTLNSSNLLNQNI